VKLTFHGAAREVTGSCALLEVDGKRVLVDCGAFQGGRDATASNAADFPFDPASIDVVLLTHAHLDHCGRIPSLVKNGFQGKIVTTAATRALTRIVLLDSARLQEEEARRAARRSRRRGEKPVPPPYDTVDALEAMDAFRGTARYGETLEVVPGVRATFHDAGHIFGSAFIVLDVVDAGTPRRIVFSGDLGNAGKAIVRDPTPPPEADVVVMESTYGDRDHRSLPASVDELHDVIRETLAGGGNVLIPTFALERAQDVLYALRDGLDRGRIPKGTRVFLDSPMAVNATSVFRRHPDCYDEEARALFDKGLDPFSFPGLEFTTDVNASMAINEVKHGAVILAGAGMCTGGRIVHHLKRNLWRHECAIAFVSFAAQGTPARRIIDGKETVRILGETVAVNARVATINGFSGHAGASELAAWRAHAGKRARTRLVHGDPGPMDALAARFTGEGFDVVTPERGVTITR
jgi:metallo-beta-lactamase family protein